jgi:hypothetical protein
VIHHDAKSVERLRSILERRFGADDDIVTERSAEAALTSLHRLAGQGTDVALVLSAQRLPELSGVELRHRSPGSIATRAGRCSSSGAIERRPNGS